MRRLGLPTLTLLLLLVLLLAGCGGEPEPTPDPSPTASFTVAPRSLEEQVAVTLADEVGRLPDEVECLDPLPAAVGAEVRCTVLDGTVELGATITATAVRGNTVDFDVAVDEEPAG